MQLASMSHAAANPPLQPRTMPAASGATAATIKPTGISDGVARQIGVVRGASLDCCGVDSFLFSTGYGH